MSKYKVTITATITKVITVDTGDEGRGDADDETKAYNMAHELFDATCDGTEEKYDEHTDSIHKTA